MNRKTKTGNNIFEINMKENKNMRKIKKVVISLLLVCMFANLTACGMNNNKDNTPATEKNTTNNGNAENNTNNNSATEGVNGNGTNAGTDTNGDGVVDDVIDGAEDAVNGVGNGVENAVDDATTPNAGNNAR